MCTLAFLLMAVVVLCYSHGENSPSSTLFGILIVPFGGEIVLVGSFMMDWAPESKP